MGLFHRRRRPVEHDCRYREAWRSAAARASARKTWAAVARYDAAQAAQARDRMADELAAAHATVGELLRDATSRAAAGLPQWRGTDGSGLAARVVEAERRAAAAMQRAGLAEKGAARLDELLARAEGRPYDSRRVDAPVTEESTTEGVA